MKKTLVIFLILATIMVTFFWVIEFMNTSEPAKANGDTVLSYNPDGEVEQLSYKQAKGNGTKASG